MDLAIAAPFLAAIVGAMLGSVVGPSLASRFEKARSKASFIRDQRRGAYTAFAIHVESAQRKADATISLVPSASYTLTDLDELELARVKIDLFGTHVARVWAYRCTLALIALQHAICEAGSDLKMIELPRAKLHEARSNLVRVLRAELGVSGHEKADYVSKNEVAQSKAENRAIRRRVDSQDHKVWLGQLPADPTALRVSEEAVAVYRRSTNSALATGALGGGEDTR